jgi:hypothetical protein
VIVERLFSNTIRNWHTEKLDAMPSDVGKLQSRLRNSNLLLEESQTFSLMASD